jgi:hypothetical protein
MNMVKKLVLAVSVMLAITFTFGCSKDDDDKENKEYVFCNWVDGNILRMCQELMVGGDFSKSQLEQECTSGGGNLVDKCQDTALKCPMSKDGIEMVAYFYEPYPDGIKNCNDLPK